MAYRCETWAVTQQAASPPPRFPAHSERSTEFCPAVRSARAGRRAARSLVRRDDPGSSTSQFFSASAQGCTRLTTGSEDARGAVNMSKRRIPLRQMRWPRFCSITASPASGRYWSSSCASRPLQSHESQPCPGPKSLLAQLLLAGGDSARLTNPSDPVCDCRMRLSSFTGSVKGRTVDIATRASKVADWRHASQHA